MGSGDYINKLVEGVRSDLTTSDKKKEKLEGSQKSVRGAGNSDLNTLLESMRKFEIKGDTKRLIRMDSRTEEILKLLNPTLKVDVTSFVNFLCWDFLEKNPELINEIKQSLKKI